MASGRHGGCRYNEFRDREIHADSYRRKDCYQDHFRGGFLDEIRFREFSDRVGFSHGDVNGLDVDIRRSEPVVAPPRSKKRKLSLIACDRDESKCSGILNSNIKNVVLIQDDVSIDLAERPAENEVVLPKNLVEETEDFSPVWNISSSRWADADDAFGDGEAGKVTNPELGEIVSSLERKVSKALGSEGGHGSSGSNDLMDIDKEEADDEGNGCLSETDVESEDGEFGNQESPVYSPSRSMNMLQSCRGVDEFEKLNKINEGTYGVVYRARDKKTGEIVALKKVKMEREREGFPLTSLREINILLSLHHPSVIDVKEVVTDCSLNNIFMVMEYMDCDLKGLMEQMKQPFSQSEVKCLMLQLLEGVKYLHDNWVLHRDLKTSNVLFNNRGELKLCDFGLSRQYGSPLKPYTPLVVTLWYRAPELLLGAKGYSAAIDMWSLGCIMAELLTKEPLFNGKNEIEQLGKIFEMLGTPTEETWPGFTKLPSAKVKFVKQIGNKLWQKFRPTSFSGCPILSLAGLDLLLRLLTCDPEKRITAEEALQHDWFREVPLPKSKDFMPTFPALNARER